MSTRKAHKILPSNLIPWIIQLQALLSFLSTVNKDLEVRPEMDIKINLTLSDC